MLTQLRIENFAIISRLELEFGPGLVTFTGETGAGKSIILDAVEALVGGRAEVSAIRSGAERAILEASFKLPESSRAAIQEILEREDLLDDPNYLTLGRELRREGRSTARVNGRSVSLSLLRELGSYLVDIHGQSEHLSLLNVRQHLGLLDRYAASESLLAAYRQVYRQLLGLRRELKALRQGEQESSHRLELMTFQLNEIESASLKPGEEEELRRERDRLANAENLAGLAQQAVQMFEEGSPDAPALSDLLGQLVQILASLSRIDASQARLHQQAEEQMEVLSDLSRDLQDYLEKIEYNPRRLEQVEERLDLLHNIKRKYGGTIEAALVFGRETRQKLEDITHATERIAEMESEEKALLGKLGQAGQQLSQQRRKAAEKLARSVEKELGDLKMAGARFSVDFQTRPDPQGVPGPQGELLAFDDDGLERAEFLIAPNPGEGFKPMVKIASGGETSRLMLALKNVLAQADAIPTLIFDEIDQGIGGRVGSVVGEKLWTLGRGHQVLCVTHLPQLAAFGDQHFRVAKEVLGDRTTTQVDALDEAARREELAQMLGALNQANRQAAEETLKAASGRKQELQAC